MSGCILRQEVCNKRKTKNGTRFRNKVRSLPFVRHWFKLHATLITLLKLMTNMTYSAVKFFHWIENHSSGTRKVYNQLNKMRERFRKKMFSSTRWNCWTLTLLTCIKNLITIKTYCQEVFSVTWKCSLPDKNVLGWAKQNQKGFRKKVFSCIR